MKATAHALKERSLDLFKTALKDFKEREHNSIQPYTTKNRHADGAELQQDPLIRSHLSVLYDTLLEQNLVRVIEPYSAVELSWVAQEVGQSVQIVEEKLSQMILDQVFYGVLNENVGTLEVYDEPTEDVSIRLQCAGVAKCSSDRSCSRRHWRWRSSCNRSSSSFTRR